MRTSEPCRYDPRLRRLTIRLSDLCSQRLEEMAHPSETASKTVARIINAEWCRRRGLGARNPETIPTRGIDAARQEFFTAIGAWPEDTGNEDGRAGNGPCTR